MIPRSSGAIRWLVRFVAFAATFYALACTTTYRAHLFPASLRVYASAAAALLRAFGSEVAAHGNALVSATIRLEVREGCDAAEPMMLFAAAVLASPVSWRARGLGMGLAIGILPVVNVLRIVSLYFARQNAPGFFHALHVEIWQPVFLALTIALWIFWATRTASPRLHRAPS